MASVNRGGTIVIEDKEPCCCFCARQAWPPFATTFFRLAVGLMLLAWILSICAIGGTYWTGFSASGTSLSSRSTLFLMDLQRLTWCSSRAFCDSFFEKGIALKSLVGTQDLIAASQLCFNVFLASTLIGLACGLRLAMVGLMSTNCCSECCGDCCPIVRLPGVQDRLYLTWTRISMLAYAVAAVACFAAVRSYSDAASAAYPRFQTLWWQATRNGATGGTPPTSWSFDDGFNCALTAAIFNASIAVLFALCVYMTRDLDGGSTLCGVSDDGSGGMGHMGGHMGMMDGGSGMGQGRGMVSDYPPRPGAGGPYMVQQSPLAGPGGGGMEGLLGPGSEGGTAVVPTASLFSYPGAGGTYAPQVYGNSGPQVLSMPLPQQQRGVGGMGMGALPGSQPLGPGPNPYAVSGYGQGQGMPPSYYPGPSAPGSVAPGSPPYLPTYSGAPAGMPMPMPISMPMPMQYGPGQGQGYQSAYPPGPLPQGPMPSAPGKTLD